MVIGTQIRHEETYLEYKLESSLGRQDNLAEEEGNTGVKYTREKYTIGHRWDALGRSNDQTHLRDNT